MELLGLDPRTDVDDSTQPDSIGILSILLCGVWYARSLEIATSKAIQPFSWMRIAPDLIFAAGAILLWLFLIRGSWLSFLKKST